MIRPRRRTTSSRLSTRASSRRFPTLPNAINPKPGSATPNLVSSLVDPNFPDGFPTLADLQSSLDVAKKEKRRTLPAAATGLAALSQLSFLPTRCGKGQPVRPRPRPSTSTAGVGAGEIRRAAAVPWAAPSTCSVRSAPPFQPRAPPLFSSSPRCWWALRSTTSPRTHYTLDANVFGPRQGLDRPKAECSILPTPQPSTWSSWTRMGRASGSSVW